MAGGRSADGSVKKKKERLIARLVAGGVSASRPAVKPKGHTNGTLLLPLPGLFLSYPESVLRAAYYAQKERGQGEACRLHRKPTSSPAP